MCKYPDATSRPHRVCYKRADHVAYAGYESVHMHTGQPHAFVAAHLAIGRGQRVGAAATVAQAARRVQARQVGAAAAVHGHLGAAALGGAAARLAPNLPGAPVTRAHVAAGRGPPEQRVRALLGSRLYEAAPDAGAAVAGCVGRELRRDGAPGGVGAERVGQVVGGGHEAVADQGGQAGVDRKRRRVRTAWLLVLLVPCAGIEYYVRNSMRLCLQDGADA